MARITKLDMENLTYKPRTAAMSRFAMSYVLCKPRRRKTSSRISIYRWLTVEQREILPPCCKFQDHRCCVIFTPRCSLNYFRGLNATYSRWMLR